MHVPLSSCFLGVLAFVRFVHAQEPLTPDIMEMAVTVAELANAHVFGIDDLQHLDSTEPNTHYLVDSPEAVFLRFIDDKCYTVFSSTRISNLQDTLENLQIFPAIQLQGNSFCLVHSGFYQGLYSPSYFSDLRNRIEECRVLCNGGCEMIFGGHSQGASIALIASLAFARFDPITISLGGVAALNTRDPRACPLARPDRIYRFEYNMEKTDIRPEVSLFPRTYTYHDIIPRFLWTYDNVGSYYMISDFKDTVAAFGDRTRLDDSWPRALEVRAHESPRYVQALQHLRELYPSSNVPIAGWRNGVPCQEDLECMSGYCHNFFCERRLEHGEICQPLTGGRRQCLSESCNLVFCGFLCLRYECGR